MSWADEVADIMAGNTDPDTGFGSVCTYQPSQGSPFPVNGIFYDGHARTAFAGGIFATVSQQTPTLTVRLSDFPAPPDQNDTVLVPEMGVPSLYKVSDVQPDGLGIVKLILQR